MITDIGQVIVKEEVVLEKFDNENGEMILRERVFIVDGVIIRTEFFDELGQYLNTVEGGNNGTN